MPILLAAVVALIVLGVAIFAVQSYLPVNPTIKNLACFLLVMIFLVWLVGAMGWMPAARWR